MGNCCWINHYITDNSIENIIRTALSEMKIRKFSFSEIVESFRKFDVFLDDSKTEERHLIDEENYEMVIRDFWINESKTNIFYFLHRIYVPTFSEILENGINYAYNLYALAISKPHLYNYRNVLYIISTDYISQNKETQTVFKFSEFLEYYLMINLIYYTKKTIHVLCKLDDCAKFRYKNIDFDLTWTDNIKSEMIDILRVYSYENLIVLKNEVIEKLKGIILKEFKNEIKGKIYLEDLKINERHLDILNVYFPFLFNLLELRVYFYKRFHDHDYVQ